MLNKIRSVKSICKCNGRILNSNYRAGTLLVEAWENAYDFGLY